MNNFFSRAAIVFAVHTSILTSCWSSSRLFAQVENPLTHLQAPSSPVHFDVLDLSKTSLRYVDEDAAFYTGSFQLEKQWGAFLQGPFAKHVLNSKAAKKVMDAFTEKWDNRQGDIGDVRAQLDNPNVNGALSMLGDMFHDEIFVYGSSEFATSSVEMAELAREIQTQVLSSVQENGPDPEQILEYLTSLDKSRLDAIKIPTFVIGGKVDNKNAALEQLSMLEALISVGLNVVPPQISQAFKHYDDEAGTRFSFVFETSMIPWEALDGDLGPFGPELQRLLGERTICITLGMFDEYVIFAVSPSPEALMALRKVEDSLAESDKIDLVKDKSKLPILGISYTSDEMAVANFKVNLDHYFSKTVRPQLMIQQMQFGLVESDEEDEGWQEFFSAISEDMEWLDEQIGEHIPTFEGNTAVAVAVSDGMESWVQNRTKSVMWDSQKKLPILDHLGGKPVGFIAARHQYHPEYFETARRIVQKVRTYLDRIVTDELLDEDELEQLQEGLDKGWPLLVELADIIEQNFIPSTKDGQFAWVLSESQIKAKKFGDMPESTEELPLLEFAEVLGVNDSELLIDGFEKFFALSDKTVDVVREVEPDSIPEGYAVPRPESRSNPAGKNFLYQIPSELGLPASVLPQALFIDGFAIFNYSEPQLKSLTATSPLTVGSAFIKSHESLGAIMYLDAGRLFKQVKPWVRYSAMMHGEATVVPANDGMPEITRDDVLELYDAFTKLGEFVSVESGSEDGTIAHGRYIRGK